MAYFDPFFHDAEPWDAAHIGLDQWEEGFARDWVHEEISEDASYEDVEKARQANELIDSVTALCERASLLYKAMLKQEISPGVDTLLREIAEVPTRLQSFDTRRLHLTPDAEPLWQHVELALIRDALTQMRHRPSRERRLVYQLLFLTAVETRISPVAAWYLERAARLLLYGLEVECVAMCRAVLEAALRFRLSDDDLDRLGIVRRQGGFNLAGRIAGAKKAGIFDSRDAVRAKAIRELGNAVLHPGDAEEFDRVIREAVPRTRVADLAVLLRKLFPV